MVCETVVIGLNWVGDNVLALPAYKALQHRFRSEGGIAVAAPANVATLLEATGVFKQVVAWNRGMRHRVSALRAGRFRRAVILPNSFRAAAITFAAGIEEQLEPIPHEELAFRPELLAILRVALLDARPLLVVALLALAHEAIVAMALYPGEPAVA